MGPANLAFSCRYDWPQQHGWYDSNLPTYPQIYKDGQGYSYAVAETLERVAAKEDNFLREIRVKVFQKTGRLIVVEALDTVGFINCLVWFINSLPTVAGTCSPLPCMFCWNSTSVQDSPVSTHCNRRETGDYLTVKVLCQICPPEIGCCTNWRQF